VLVVWAADDRLMPIASGRRLADAFPNSRFVEVAGSYTLVTEDQPAELSAHLREFIKQRGFDYDAEPWHSTGGRATS